MELIGINRVRLHNFIFSVFFLIDIFMKINAVPLDILLSQKILAVLYCLKPVGRDFYDVIFLFSKTNPSYHFLREKMKLK